MTIKCFTKNERGFNSHFNLNDFDFKNENEWRFVPTKRQIGQKLISMDKGKYLENPDHYNNQLRPFAMKFSSEDVEFIFVNNAQEKEEIMKQISLKESNVIISKWNTNKIENRY